MSDDEFLTPQEAARLLRVAPVTVRQWAQRGELAFHTTPGGHRRYARAAIETFARQRGIPLADGGADGGLRVLVVDDDPHISAFLALLLRDHDPTVQVECAGNGFEAGFRIESFAPDVVLLDLMMPDLDGFEVARFIRREPLRAATRIICITAYDTPENIARAINAGAEACLGKPLDTGRLLELVFAATPLRAGN